MKLKEWRLTQKHTLAKMADALLIENARTYQRYEEGENRIDAPLAERIMTFTSGAVSLQDLHDQRVSWLRDNRPAVFADVREAAE